MSEAARRHPISDKGVLYQMPGVDAVTVRSDVEFSGADSGALTLDVYSPPGSSGALAPAVVIVAGFPDPGFETRLGCKFKEMESVRSWARLMAASGLAAVAYTNRAPEPDLQALLRSVRQNAAAWGIDETRIGLFASSGNVPLALSILIKDAPQRLKCAVLLYGYMLDLDGSTGIAEASKTFGFANPCAGRSVDDLSHDTPLFLARAGREESPRLNEMLDRFVAGALARNLPLSLVNHPAGPHAFDLFHDSETTREIVRQTLAFLRFHLATAPLPGETRLDFGRV